jgi:hypothetical protein
LFRDLPVKMFPRGNLPFQLEFTPEKGEPLLCDISVAKRRAKTPTLIQSPARSIIAPSDLGDPFVKVRRPRSVPATFSVGNQAAKARP